MIEKDVIVKLKSGLQARPAARFVQEANRFASEVMIKKDHKQVNAKSIMGLMSLAVGHQAEITFVIDGHDEQEAMDVLIAFVENE